jgi:Tol biopolymer transport system component
VDGGTLRARILASDLATTGIAAITVFTPPPGGGVSTGLTVSVVNGVPSVTALSSSAGIAGQGEFTLTVRGTRFTEASVVRWNGSDRATTYVDGGMLRATILGSDVATAGTASLAVFNPPPGGGVSGTLSFVVLAPPGGRIAFESTRDGNREIYAMNADGTGQVNLTNNPAYDANPSWSPDGSKIAFVSDRDGNREIYAMNADGTGQVNLTNNPADDWRVGAINDWAPAWSPDGSRILFATDRDGNEEIYVMNADGSGQTNLTNRADDDWRPGWSPDGSKIVWMTQPSPGDWEIHVMNADGTGQVNLTNTPGALDGAPAWSPDGSRIAFGSSRDVPIGLLGEVYVMDADGTNAVRVTNSPSDEISTAWSPDGSWIVFYSRAPGSGWELTRISAAGTNRLKLGNGSASRPASWSHDGWWVAFSSGGAGDVHMADVDGLVVVNLTNVAGEDRYPTWRPEP